MIALRILCRIEEQDIVIFGVTSYILYERNCGSILVKLHAIARRKLVEAALFVCEPFAQFRGWRYILGPKVWMQSVFGNAPRP